MTNAARGAGLGDGVIAGDYLWDKALAQAVDRLSSEQFLIAPEILMENAGRAVAQVASELLKTARGDDVPVVVLAGPGNNGGDALVAARWLIEAGAVVHVLLVGGGPKESSICARQALILRALGVELKHYAPGALKPFYAFHPLVIDGVIGIGFRGPLAEESPSYKALAEASRLHGATVLAIDLPSGLDGDVGDAQVVPLPADVTVTFGGKKPAHVLAPSRDLCGDVVVADAGFPRAALDAALGSHRPFLLEPSTTDLLALAPWASLPRSAHKYDRGHVLVIGGSAGKTGAPLLTAMAALRSGAGWVTVAMPDSATATLAGDVPRELTFEPLFDGERLNAINLQRFLEERRVRAVVCGPGAMSNLVEVEAMAVLAEFTAGGGFVVLDAGATHGAQALLAGIESLPLSPERWLLTPHPGEWRRLGPAFDFAPLSAVGIRRAQELAERMRVSILYKHATPVLVTGTPSAPAFVMAEGSRALARAGSGDVFAGVVAAHGAIGLTTAPAALRAQALVGRAARLAATRVGDDAVLASDVIESLGRAAWLGAMDEAGSDEEEDEDDEDDGHDGRKARS